MIGLGKFFTILFSVCTLAIMNLLSSCGSYTSMQTGRTIGANTGEVTAGMFVANNTITNKISIGDRKLIYPLFQASFRYGIIDPLDIGITFNTFGQLGLDGKFQIIGDRESIFALSAGFGFNTYWRSFYDLIIPVYLSVHPVDKLSIYLTPKWVHQSIVLSRKVSLSYINNSMGVLYGDQVKYGLEASYAFPLTRVIGQDVFPNIFTFGGAIKWTLGNKKQTNSSKSKIRF